jgi:hypothetical protein
MSAFNILNSDVQCSSCGQIYEGKIQFKFGDTWQFHYRIGDKIRWGGNDIGKPGISKVKVYGILESTECPICGKFNENNEYDINIECDYISGINPISTIKEYLVEDGNYRNLD